MNTEDSISKDTHKSFWTSVTPLSKYLAMALFVALPFIGGWAGYNYAFRDFTKEIDIKSITEEIDSDSNLDTNPIFDWQARDFQLVSDECNEDDCFFQGKYISQESGEISSKGLLPVGFGRIEGYFIEDGIKDFGWEMPPEGYLCPLFVVTKAPDSFLDRLRENNEFHWNYVAGEYPQVVSNSTYLETEIGTSDFIVITELIDIKDNEFIYKADQNRLSASEKEKILNSKKESPVNLNILVVPRLGPGGYSACHLHQNVKVVDVL